MSPANYVVCVREGCDNKFLKRVHNQIFCNPACCQIATNERILNRYYEKKKPISKNRVCKKRSCSTLLSVYNRESICETCSRKDQMKALNRKIPM